MLVKHLNCFCLLPVVVDQATSVEERVVPIPHKNGEATSILEREGKYPKENGERRSNGVELHTKSNRSADRPGVVGNHQGKSRFSSTLMSFLNYSPGPILFAHFGSVTFNRINK